MMDKRLFLAFSLSGLVVVATPFLFPRGKVPPAPAAAVAGDSQRTAAALPAPTVAAAPATTPGVPAQDAGGTGARPAGTIGASATPAVGAPAIAAEPLAGNTKVRHTHLSTLGGAPVLV